MLPILRDKEFAKRLLIACEGHPHCPTQGRGKQKWLREEVQKRFKLKASAESFRRYFAGENRPRPDLLSKIAQILEVDEAWLSLGRKPTLTVPQKKQHDAMAVGAVNLVAGLIQLNGGHVAFPEPRQAAEADLFAIISGKQHKVKVHLAIKSEERFTFDIDDGFESRVIIGVVLGNLPSHFRLLRINPEIIAAHGKHAGDFWKLSLQREGQKFKADYEVISEITNFLTLDAKSATTREGARLALDL